MTTTIPQEIEAGLLAVAPWCHTSLLIAFFLLMSAGGAALQYRPRAPADRVEHRPAVTLLYLSMMAGNGADLLR